jgi:hypothetical protein
MQVQRINQVLWFVNTRGGLRLMCTDWLKFLSYKITLKDLDITHINKIHCRSRKLHYCYVRSTAMNWWYKTDVLDIRNFSSTIQKSIVSLLASLQNIRVNKMHTMAKRYKYYVSGHCPSSCFYLKHSPVYTSKHNISEIGISSINWAQLSRFYLKTETECSLQNVVFLNINRMMDMSRNIIFALMYYSHKLLDLMEKRCFLVFCYRRQMASNIIIFSYRSSVRNLSPPTLRIYDMSWSHAECSITILYTLLHPF